MYWSALVSIIVCSPGFSLSGYINLLYKWHGRGYYIHQFDPLFFFDLDHEDFPMLLSNSLKNAVLMAI